MEETKEGQEDYCLSDGDIKRVCECTGLIIVKYPDLARFATWKDFMKNRARAAAVLFLVQSEVSGHWIAAFDGPDGKSAHVWDPLGLPLDGQRAAISKATQARLGETKGEFARLLATAEAAGIRAVVNHKEFQEFKPSINTCGRWVALRLLHRDKTDQEFAAYVREGVSRSGVSTDEWVTDVTNPKLAGGSMLCHTQDEEDTERQLWVCSKDPGRYQRFVECQVDRVGSGGAFAEGVVSRMVKEAGEAHGLSTGMPRIMNETISSWRKLKGGCTNGPAFWKALQGAALYVSKRMKNLEYGGVLEQLVSRCDLCPVATFTTNYHSFAGPDPNVEFFTRTQWLDGVCESNSHCYGIGSRT
jgi:hypothetical protein